MKKKPEVIITGTAQWTAIPDPLFYVECPHCKNIILLSSPTVIEKLTQWGKKLFSKR